MSAHFHPGLPVPVPFSHGKPKRVLTRGSRACDRVSASGQVNAVYPNAMEVCGNLGAVKGLGVLFGLLVMGFVVWSMYFAWLVASSKSATAGDLWFAVVVAIGSTGMCYAAVWFLRKDLFTYRDEPVLFNRRTRKVHLSRRRINMKRPFSPWPVVIDTYDWDCIRGEIKGGVAYNGSMPVMRYWLYLSVSDKPRSKEVVDRFVVGMHGTSVIELAWLWEHTRRYMEEDGPPVQPGEWLNPDKDSSPVLEAWALSFPFLSKHASLRRSAFMYFLAVVAFPFMWLLSFCTWLAEITCRNPQWPQHIIDEAGGAPLSDDAIRALIPSASIGGYAANDDGDSRIVCKPWWTAERRKYVLLVLAIVALFGGGKLLLFWVRGY